MPIVPEAIVEPNCFNFQINNFQCNLALPNRWGLVNLLTQSAEFYSATLTADQFDLDFRSARREKIGAILDIIKNPRVDHRHRYVDFQIKMLHEALNTKWQYPALISRHRGQLIWHTGGIRLLATGMVKPNREQDLPVLVTDFDRDRLGPFQDILPIYNDQQLSSLLGVEYFDYRQHQPGITGGKLEVFLEWQSTPGPCLHYIKPATTALDWATQGDVLHVPDLLPALTKLLKQPRIHYWSQTPDQLTDSSGLFELCWMGDQSPILSERDRSWALYQHKQFAPRLDGIEWWIHPGRHLDAGELLFWLDQKYTVYLDRDEQFAIMLDHDRFDKKLIAMSR